MVKLIVCMLAGNCENTIDMALESIKEADDIHIIYDATSKDRTWDKIQEWNLRNPEKKPYKHQRTYDHSLTNKQANGEARNFYLDIVKKRHLNDYCLVIDADEVVDDLPKLKEWINKYQSIFDLYPCCSIKMRHFIGDLGHEDSTVPEHFVLNRLFKIVPDLYYPLGEHPILQCRDKEARNYACREVVVWHLGYVPNLNYYKSRYETHSAKSEIHDANFLKQWYYWHLFGSYPKSAVNPIDIPKVILNNFGIDKDEIYFSNRLLENKHWIDVIKYKEYFKL